MQNYLAQENNIDAIHIIGHGSAGQIAFGTALLNESTLEEYKSSLSTIGASLTADGDILFYGCNIADGKTGETLINQIATITNADIGASDDVTGQGGDWDLEKHTGIIETKNIVVANYAHSLANGVASVDSSVVELHSATNFRARWSGTNGGGQTDSSSDRFILTQERADVTGGAGTLSFDYAVAASSHTPSTDNPVHVYLLFSNDNTDSNSRRTGSRTGVVTFENEILGIFTDPTNTIAMTGISKSGATYPTSSSPKIGMRDLEYNNSNPPGTQGNKDWFRVYNSNKSVEIGTKNGLKGDFIRIITRAPVSNTDPVARNDRGIINEDDTLNVSNNANANVSADNNINTTGEHSGDVIDTNLAGRQDTDADGDTLTVTEIRTGSSEGSGTAGSLGSFLTGTYGRLRIYSSGAYDYIADQSATDALDPGDTATDSFNYTISDGNGGTDKAVIEIVIIGVNDDITAVNDTDAVNEDKTISRSTSDAQELDQDDTDPDGDDASGSFTITAIRTGRETGSGTSGTVGSALTGTYGVLTVNSNGSYSYAASTSGADGLSAGATAIDYFTYTVQDHSGGDTDTAELAITVTGVGPQAVNDTGAVNENATLSKNEAQGVISNDDDDASYDSESLEVTGIRTGAESGSGTSGTVGSALTGTYGVLTIAADGSYSYVANTAAAEALDANDEVTDVFTYTVSDDADVNSDTGQITITITGVDDDPVGVNDTGAVNEDATLSVNTASGVLSNDTDADDSANLTVSAISSGTVGQAKNGTYGALTLNSNGSYTYVANQSGADGLAAGATATDTFTYTVSDGAGTTDTATLTIIVKGVGPAATNDTGSVNEDATLSINSGSGVTSNDTGGDTESLEVTNIRTGTESGSGTSGSVGTALTGTYGELTINADGSYEYVANQNAADALDPGETATDTFTYTVKDDDNKNADTGEIVITVTGINDEIIAVDDTDSVNEDATISRSTSDAQELDADDTDADGDDVPGAFTITAIRTGSESGSGTSGTIGQALTGTYGTLTVNADGSYTYVADQNAADSIVTGQTATDTFTYTVRDHSGGDTDTAELVFTVTGINDENPVAVDDTDSVNRDATIERAAGSSFDINADDTDADGDSLTITGISIGQTEGGGTSGTVGSALVGTYGTLTLNSDGSYSYTADQDAANSLKRGDSAIDYFNYTVSDGTNEDIGVIAITINGISDPPVPVDDTLAIDASAQTIKNSSSGVLVNDTDPDGDTITVDSIRTGQESGTGTTGTVGSVITGTYGDLTINSDGSYTYQANNAKSVNPGDTVTDYFTYTATDTETSVPAQISITVTGINDRPEVISPINVPTLLTDQNVVIKYIQAFDDPDSGSYDITQYKVIDPESEQETSLPTGLYIEGNKLKGKIKTPGDYSITLRAIDGAGLYVDHTFTIKVIPSVNEISESADNDKPVKLKTIKVKPKKDLELSLAAFDNSDIPQIDEMVLEKKLTFNGGMKVLNVVAQETQTTNELQVEVMVNDDNRQDVESYSGLLSDGTPLPEWVKVNPDTGETSAAMPDDIDNVEVQVIALDKDGTVRDINIVLDKPAIKNDSQILRNDSNLFQGENVFVDGENKVTFVDKTIDRAARNIIELNKVQDEVAFTANLKLGNIAFSEGQYSINFIDDNKSNVSNYRIELDSGKSIPSWLSLDNKTGEITAIPPSGEKGIGIKLIAEDEDGTERTIEVDIDFDEVLQLQDDLSYVPLNDQINEIITSADNYGERLINQLG